MRERVRRGGRERSTEALRWYRVECEVEDVRAGGARPEGLGSIEAVSRGEA